MLMDPVDIFNRQQVFFEQLKKQAVSSRVNKLQKIKAQIQRYQPEIEAALMADLHKPKEEAQITEILVVLMELSHQIKNLENWSKPQRQKRIFPFLFFGKPYYLPQPKGNVLVLSPWNYPFQLAMAPVIGAIAAGNTVILKPSEFTPNTNSVIAKILDFFHADEVSVITGDAETASTLTSLPFNHIFFTGSTEVGKKVMAAAANNLADITLELGGKSPAIVCKDVDIERSAERIVWGKLINSGQTCVAPDYILVDEGIADKVLSAIQKAIELQTKKGESKQAHVINEAQSNRLQKLRNEVIASGATVLFEQELDNGKTLPFIILGNVPLNSQLMKTEIFGPILPFYTYQNLDEALNFIHQFERPLALYLFTQNKKTIDLILRSSHAGGVSINDTLVQQSHTSLAFGGINHSGIGKYHGIESFKTFSHYKPVFEQAKFTPFKFLYPPYSKFGKGVLRFLMGYFYR